MTSILSVEHQEFPLFEFRIYLQAAGEQSDVRLVGRAVFYAADREIRLEPVDNSHEDASTAFDRVDDRTFRDPFSDPTEPVYNRCRAASLRGDSAE